MRLTIAKKIALLLLILYPGFVVMGLIGIWGIDKASRSSYEIINQTNLVIQLEDMRSNLLKGRSAFIANDAPSVSAYLEVLKQQAETTLNFIREHSFSLADKINKENILKTMVSQLYYPDVSRNIYKIDNMLLALDVLVKDAQVEFRQKSISPYKSQRVSIAALVILTFVLVLGVALSISYVNHSIRQPLQKITRVTTALSELKGDLTQRLNIEKHDEIGDLARAFNQMLINLAELMRGVKEVGGRLVESSHKMKEISQAQTEINLRQASQINEAGAVIENLRNTASEVARSSQEATRSLKMSAQFTHEGKDVAAQIVAGIDRVKEKMDSLIKQVQVLEGKSRSINKILDWIEEISKKIDMLALNFNIEVNKFEAPEGLGALAKEVRRLSERSQEATTEIRKMIGQIQEDIRGMVSFADAGNSEIKQDLELITRIKGTNEKIDRVTAETNALALQIYSAIEEQQRLFSDAVKLIVYIQGLSQESLSQTKGIESLSQQIEAFSHQLKQAIGEFKLD